MTGAEVIGRSHIRGMVNRLAEEIAAEFDPDETGAQVESYLVEVRSDLSEAILEGIVKVVDDTPAFEDWRTDRDGAWL